jgi:hypothetical protein
VRKAHSEDNGCEGNSDDRQDDPASETIDQSTNADGEESANQGGPKVYAREVDAIDLQISQKRFGYESETLRAAGQSADHCERRDEDVHPAVIKRQCDRLLTYFSSHKQSQRQTRYYRALATNQNPAQNQSQRHKQTDPSSWSILKNDRRIEDDED